MDSSAHTTSPLPKSPLSKLPRARNLLPLQALLLTAIFIFDLQIEYETSIEILYVLVVMLGLWSSHRWHTVAAAVTATAAIAINAWLEPPSAVTWLAASDIAMPLLALWGVCLLGTSYLRKIHSEATARNLIMRVQDEREQLRLALERAETAEAQNRQQTDAQRVLAERLSVATRAAGIAIWEWDLKTDRFIGDENRLPAFHFQGAQDSLEEISRHIHPEDRNELANALHLARTTTVPSLIFQLRVQRPDGTLRHLNNRLQVIRDATGDAQRVLAVTMDVTNESQAAEMLQRQAEEQGVLLEQLLNQTEQLKAAERRLERASLSSLEGHWEVDMAAGKSWHSSSFATLLGYSHDAIDDHANLFDKLGHPADIAGQHRMYLEQVQAGARFDVELRLHTAGGEWRWFRMHGTAELDAAGKPIRVAGSVQDIQQQKTAEDALHTAQQRFERAIRGTQDGLWEWDIVAKTLWYSPRYEQILGYSPGEIPRLHNAESPLLHPDDRALVAAAQRAHFEQGSLFDVEARMCTKNGDYRWIRARGTAERDAAGKPLRLAGSIHDVTEARESREALIRATEAADIANRAKSAFLANVSHEIRTPMNGIIGMTGLLLETGLDRTQHDYAETIRSSADSLLTVINDILDFSKIEAGKLDIESIEMDLRGNVEDVGAMMAFQAASKNLELVVNLHPGVPERVLGDPQRIRQCLINLVGNAIKFTRGGEIVIEVAVIGRQAGRAIMHFEVRDTGIGISKETLDTLFQPFVQADSSTTRHYGGTGLGLSIVRRLVEMMGGQVGVESKVGVGSTFWFTLPLESVDSHVDIDARHDVHAGQRILIVDDNETNRRVLSGQLERSGFDVVMAAGGNEALSQMRRALGDNRPFDVVLADYQMPDMDGAMLGEQINGDPHLSRARMVMLTSMDRHGDLRRFAAMGFAGFLSKPVRARELAETLAKVLARESREWHMQSQPIITRALLADQETNRRYSGRVLLVEDNAVNQKVAQRFLERLGCDVSVVDNGEEGVKAFKTARFDIVLMDLQMPVMDGLAATRLIREFEAGEGRRSTRTPIVALTANAMAGQLERCLEAGMDAFLTKPLQISRLREVLDNFGLGMETSAARTGGSAVNSGPKSGPRAAVEAPVDLARLAEVTDGDPAFARELIDAYLASSNQSLQEMKAAAQAHDRSALTKAAHKLRGASANIYAIVVKDLAGAIETQAATVPQDELEGMIAAVGAEIERAKEHLQTAVAAVA